jgi:hypothetical protein
LGTFCADPVQEYKASNLKFIIHESSDIGLIKLDKPADLSANNVATIGLPFEYKELPEKIVASGWGLTNDYVKNTSDVLMKGTMDVNQDCRKFIDNLKQKNLSFKFDDEREFCAKGRKDKEIVLVCRGDSGGGAFKHHQANGKLYYVLHGITSWSYESIYFTCRGDRRAAVFVNVYSYIDWILRNTEEKIFKNKN